jgi:hypothetical protein
VSCFSPGKWRVLVSGVQQATIQYAHVNDRAVATVCECTSLDWSEPIGLAMCVAMRLLRENARLCVWTPEMCVCGYVQPATPRQGVQHCCDPCGS